MSKTKTKYYILANGEGTRWKNYLGVPKQLIEIDGETILHRMIRLLREEGVAKSNIFICGPFEDAEAKTIITQSKTKREVFEEIAELAKGPFVILYGDCYYTAPCIHQVVHRPIKKYDEFFNVHPNPNTGCRWAEGYAHRCVDWEWWRDQMHELNTNPEAIAVGHDWFIHWWLLGVKDGKMNEHPVECYDPDHDIPWCDQTDDFDYPDDVKTFQSKTGHKVKGVRENKFSIIIPHYNTPQYLKVLLDNLVFQRNKYYPETEIIVIDDHSSCNMLWLEAYHIKTIYQKENKGASAARNAGLDAATGEYIAFVDADDNVEPDYLHTLYTIMRKTGCDYALFPFFVVANGTISQPRDELIANYAVWDWAFTADCIGNERFDENLNVAEDVDWLRRVVTPEKKRYQSEKAIYRYDWNANPDSLCKRFNRGDLPKEKQPKQ